MLRKEIIDNMKYIVDNCMGDSSPACVATCPMHTNVKEYVRLIAEGKGKESIKVIREKLFMPKTLGRICAHPCEQNCKWNEKNNPMSIAGLKRYAADNFDDPSDWDLSTKPKNGKKVAIIGAGPSGAQAALDLIKEGFEVTVFDKLEVYGGMMRVGIPEYRLPRNIIDFEYSYLEKLGINFKMGVEVGKDIKFEEIKNEFDAVVVAVGKHIGRIDRSLENHDAKGIFSAAEYLKEISLTRNVNGIGKKVVVIGGGDVAMDCARSSLRLDGVEEVYSVCLEESYEKMAASTHEIKASLKEGVKFNLGFGINKILVDENKRVKGIELKKCLSMFDENGNFAPQFNENDIKVIDVDTIVFAIGQNVDSSFDEKNLLNKRKNGTFECDELTLQSVSDEKVFIAGDASGKSFIVIQAMATGRSAAKSVIRFLSGKDLKEGRSMEEEFSYKTKLNIPIDWDNVEKVERKEINELDPSERIKTFDEVSLGFTKEQAEKEASRCLQCECKLCMKECLMLRDYTDCPKTLFKEYLEKGYENMDPLIAYSCNQCSQCTIKCPNDFDIKSNFDEMRREYVKANGGDSPLEGHKGLDKAIELDCSEKTSAYVKARTGKRTKYVLVPGCTVPVYSPELVEKTLLHLKEALDGEVGAVLQCCAKPTLMIGEDEKFEKRFKMVQKSIDETGADVIVTLCPSCYLTYEKYAKQEVISYWDLIHQKIGLPKGQKGIGENSDVVFNIHDSCPTRHVTSHHDSVRWILKELGYKVEEMNNIRENTRCCGVGGMVGCVNPQLQEKVLNRRVNDATSNHIISYCGSCRVSMENGGLDSLHILDLIHGKTYMKKDAKKRNKSADDGVKSRLETKDRLNKYK
ncbi:FAD-dependent oxidoreductase [Tepidibacter thalassicus]|uniref:NADPH-dependent glutamate synthase beta chain n=1 Tax=Tepidibacter thalassicus DSM 15285 TaxID=1123350 RepID=A0A1M5SBM2_9FIRM|nr:FAD-dependent oxidoreductase [Tepidibacter thalassicus]SHH35313.1 NADPH-dependent glutamate synthase beta chain [Tepidibacter thalassicus DSM 15285]